VVRLQSDGRLDDSFGGDGRVTTQFSRGFDAAYGLALQPSDGRIVAAGTADGHHDSFALARYLVG
jgi:hypothetical protein